MDRSGRYACRHGRARPGHDGEARRTGRPHGSSRSGIMAKLPTVAILGRPNVGKSTLFNRLAGRKLAIVDDTPGVTRDRKEAEAVIAGRDVRLVDTAGLEEAAPESLFGRMRASSEAALREADVALFVIDVRAGITPA